MNKNLQIKLTQITNSFDEIQKQLASPNISNEERITLSKKFSSLEQIISKKNQVNKIEQSLSDSEELLNEEQDPELSELAKEDIENLKKNLIHIQITLNRLEIL